MCNPRRVMIHVARAIEEAWQTTVREAVTAEGEVTELTRLRAQIPLAEEMGDRALEMLEQLVRGDFEDYEGWDQTDDGRYCRDLGAVTLILEPGTGQLEVEASLTEQLTAEAQATAEVSGFTVGQVAVEAVGHYYDDGWGGRTEERARRDAEAAAERQLAEATEALHRREHAEELARAEASARAVAAEQAEVELERLHAQTRQALRQRLQVVLADAEDRIHHTLNRLVGEAYRRTIIRMVHENGGTIITDQQTGSVMNLEVELA